MPSLFITGTDTDCGKTHVATALLLALKAAGQQAVGYKPAAAGSRLTPEGWRNADAESLLAASASGFSYEQVNPIALPAAVAPHLAAQDERRTLQSDELLAGARRLEGLSDWVIVEGAGGFLVPLNDTHSLADLVEQAGWPVLLVVGMRLGCINHALLSVEAIQRRSRLLGWVANVLPPEQSRWQDNVDSLRARIAAPCLGVVRAAEPVHAAAELDVSALLNLKQNRLS